MSTITKTPRKSKTSKPLAPVSGTVRVLRPVGSVNDLAGEIAISGTAYYLECRGTCYTLTGYDSRKGEVTSYDLPADLSSCDCPDQTYRGERPGGCKHRKALAALRGCGKLPELNHDYKPGHDNQIPF